MTNTDRGAWWYRNGIWEPGPHAITWLEGQGGWDNAADASGFYRFTSSHQTGDAASVTVYQRAPQDAETRETWAIIIDSEGADAVYTTSLPDTMAVLAQWAPAVSLLNSSALPGIIADGVETAIEYLGMTPGGRGRVEKLLRVIRDAR